MPRLCEASHNRGKVERLFQFVDSSFRPEVQTLIHSGEVSTLEQLNASLRSWLDGYYHVREHGSTKQPPKERFEASQKPRKRREAQAERSILVVKEKAVFGGENE
ncbi:hypothetical protein IDH44_01045 [Paenibacillus sp. IB182496]|uniref:Integrase catalytic domain-containing protein n=1 Tax=Paenibacillus sabuli TaxID=2772509 RepID=A0A927BNF5_9BACL|nr:hypothetical protein [Paenibacillus sabuli]MBD2843762.1 hypothetical protein [Paenibacillus sabuli]